MSNISLSPRGLLIEKTDNLDRTVTTYKNYCENVRFGDSISKNKKIIIENAVKSLKSKNIWNKLDKLFLFTTPSEVWNRVDLKRQTPSDGFIYESDFSSTNDGVAGLNGLSEEPAQTWRGESDVLKCTLNGSSTTFFLFKFPPGATVGDLGRISFRYYLPSSNDNATQIRVSYDDNGELLERSRQNDFNVVYNSWTTYTSPWFTITDNTNNALYIYLGNDETETLTISSDEFFYIKDLKVEKYDVSKFVNYELSPSGSIAGHTANNGVDTGSEYYEVPFNPNSDGDNFSKDSACIGFYLDENLANENVLLGVNDGLNYIQVSKTTGQNKLDVRVNDSTTSTTNTLPIVDGHFLIQRNSSTTKQVYRNGQLINNFTGVSSTGLPNEQLYLFANNNNGTPVLGGSFQCGYFFIGSSLTTSEVNEVYYIMDELVARINSYYELNPYIKPKIEEVDLFIIVGQSNSRGAFPVFSNPSIYGTIITGVNINSWIWSDDTHDSSIDRARYARWTRLGAWTTGTTWNTNGQPYKDVAGTLKSTQGSGWDLYFARKMSVTYRKPTYILKYAPGGVFLVDIEQYQGQTGAWQTVHSYNAKGEGKSYDKSLSDLLAAKAILEAEGKTVNIRAIIWTQGEAEAQNVNNYAQYYYSELVSYINGWRTDLSLPFLPFIINKLNNGYDGSDPNSGLDPSTWIYLTEVNQAFDDAKTNLSNVNTIETNDLTFFDGVHYSAESIKILGERVADYIITII